MHGLDEQNGFLNKKGCTDATFALKLALQSRKEFNLDTWVVFVDLVKAFDTVNREMLMKILSRYGIPDSLINVIKCLYQPVTIKFTWGKNKHDFPSLVGVKQGDNLAPILFLFIMQAAMETLEAVWSQHNIEAPSFSWDPDSEDGSINGTITTQPTHRAGTIFQFFRSLYADDGAFMFSSRDDMINGMSLLHLHFQRCGLLMHVGTRATPSSKGSKSKTEAMYFPSKQLKDIPADELAANKADFDLTCEGGGCISFTDEFRYLGSLISCDLTDNSDIQQRIGLASKAFGSLRKEIFCNQSLKEVTRVRLFTAIVINLLLWGCESWTLTAGQRQSLNVRFNKWIRMMSRMTKLDLRNLSIKDKELRKCLGIESLNEILDRRRMKWMEKVANMPATADDNRLPRKLLGAWIFGGKRQSGGQRKTLRKSYLDLLRKLQLDSNDSALCGSKGNLKNILELICNEPAEFNLRLDHTTASSQTLPQQHTTTTQQTTERNNNSTRRDGLSALS